MKNKDPNKSLFKKKGFYVALYSSIGAVMVLAAVVSFNNLTVNPKDGQTEQNIDFNQMETTSQSNDESYLTPDDRTAGIKLGGKKTQEAEPTAEPTAPVQPSAPSAKKTETPTPAPSQGTPEAAAQTTKPEAQEKKETQNPDKPTAQSENADENQATEIGELIVDEGLLEGISTTIEEIVASADFDSFTEDSKMIWPVLGEIVMDFSDSHAIYDKTLDQYRTNDNICISAEPGTQVVASAEGIVRSVVNSKENGNTVVLDHGNGWTTTYCQLQDGVLVKEGEVVKQGQAIGGVGSPTIYSVLLGNHVEFKVAKDDSVVDPKTILE